MLLNKYNWGQQIDEDVMGGARGTYATKINTYRILVGRSDGKRPLGRPRRKSEDNTEMDVA